MGFVIGLFTRIVGERFAPLVAYGAILLILAGGVWWLRHDAYRDGVEATDAKWVEAGRRLEEQARQAAAEADEESARRVERHNQRIALEKEKLDEADASGTSPLDVLFGL